MHQRGVGGQATDDFTGLRGLEELGALLHHVGIHRAAQVGRDPFAQPGDHVKACGREQAQRRTHGEQRREVLAQVHQLLARVVRHESLIDQALESHGKGQGAGGSQQQKDQGQADLQAVGTKEGKQPAERLRALGFAAFAVGHGEGVVDNPSV